MLLWIAGGKSLAICLVLMAHETEAARRFNEAEQRVFLRGLQIVTVSQEEKRARATLNAINYPVYQQPEYLMPVVRRITEDGIGPAAKERWTVANALMVSEHADPKSDFSLYDKAWGNAKYYEKWRYVAMVSAIVLLGPLILNLLLIGVIRTACAALQVARSYTGYVMRESKARPGE